MSSPTKAELLEENSRLRNQKDLLEAAAHQELTIRELAAKMKDDGSINVQIVSGEEGISHPGIRVLAAAAISLLEIDGSVPPNYRTAGFTLKPAGGCETYVVEMASCKSEAQSPHALRMKAEAERDALKAEVEQLIGIIAKAAEFSRVRVESDCDWDTVHDMLTEDH